MNYDFDKLVNRENIGNLKDTLTPNYIKEKGIISLAGAEFDFKTAPSVIESVVKRAQNGLFGFTLADNQYLESIKWWMKKARNWDIETDWIVPTLGTIYSVATAIRLTTKENEGIIVQSPVYYRYEQAATRLNRKTVHNKLKLIDGKYEMDFEDLERCMADENNKLMILCNPHNPIGRVWKEKDLEEIARLSNKYNVVVFSDEIFAEVTFKDNFTKPYISVKGADKLGIVSTSLGKTFGFTGVNNANLIIKNEELREAYTKQKYMDHYGSIDPLVHAAVLGAYCEEGYSWMKQMRNHIESNVDYLQTFFKENLYPNKLYEMEGSYVAWIEWKGIDLKGDELDQFLKKKAFLDLEPGNEYGESLESFSRINLATTHEQIKLAMKNLNNTIKNKK